MARTKIGNAIASFGAGRGRQHLNQTTSADYGFRSSRNAEMDRLRGVMHDKRAAYKEDVVTLWDCYRRVGEVRAIISATAALVAAGLVIPMRETTQGDVTDNDGRAIQAVRDLKGPTGGLKLLLRRGAGLIQVTGDVQFVGTPIPLIGLDNKPIIDPVTKFARESGDWWFEFLSTEEVREHARGGFERRRNGSGGQRENLHVLRMVWQHLRFSGQPDTALMSAQEICVELMLLTDLIAAIAKSRLSANLLIIPDSVSFGNDHDDDEDDADSEDITDRFFDRILAHMSDPITNRKSAASLTPIVVSADGEDVDKFKVVELARDMDSFAQGLRQELLSRLVAMLEAPREEIEGKSSASQWMGVTIDKNHATKHAVPIGEFICDWLSEHWYPYWLQARYGMTEAEAENRKLVYDGSPYTKIVDTPTVMRLLHDRDLVSTEALLMACGLDPEMVTPNEEEKIERILLELLAKAPAVFAPTVLPMLGIEFIPPAAEPAAEGSEDDDENETPEGGDGDDGRDEQPPVPEEAAARDREQLAALLAGDMGASIVRASERIGAKMRSARGKVIAATREQIDSTNNEILPFALSMADQEMLGIGSPQQLLDGEFDGFRTRAKNRILSHLIVDVGEDSKKAEDYASIVALDLAGACYNRIALGMSAMDGAQRLDVSPAWVLEKIDCGAGWSR